MTPEEVAYYYDHLDNAAWACGLPVRTYPGWTAWRTPDRIWQLFLHLRACRRSDSRSSRTPV